MNFILWSQISNSGNFRAKKASSAPQTTDKLNSNVHLSVAPIISAKTWNHIVGTYDALTGIAKVFVNGRLKAEAVGKGLLSQDWDAHAGIGKHKDTRFLQGEVDEFRIYNKALSEEEIHNLMKICSFERGECIEKTVNGIKSDRLSRWPVLWKPEGLYLRLITRLILTECLSLSLD